MSEESLGAYIHRERNYATIRRREKSQPKLTQNRLAQAIGMSQAWVTLVEQDGLRTPPNEEMLRKIAEAIASDLEEPEASREADRLYEGMLARAGYTSERTPASELPESDLLRELARYGIDIGVPMPRHILVVILESVRDEGSPLVFPEEGGERGRGANRHGRSKEGGMDSREGNEGRRRACAG